MIANICGVFAAPSANLFDLRTAALCVTAYMQVYNSQHCNLGWGGGGEDMDMDKTRSIRRKTLESG
jgi:hypothetical protein